MLLELQGRRRAVFFSWGVKGEQEMKKRRQYLYPCSAFTYLLLLLVIRQGLFLFLLGLLGCGALAADGLELFFFFFFFFLCGRGRF